LFKLRIVDLKQIVHRFSFLSVSLGVKIFPDRARNEAAKIAFIRGKKKSENLVTIDNQFLPNEKEEKTLVRGFPLDGNDGCQLGCDSVVPHVFSPLSFLFEIIYLCSLFKSSLKKTWVPGIFLGVFHCNSRCSFHILSEVNSSTSCTVFFYTMKRWCMCVCVLGST